jgi:nucleoside 2-deoxyribosyltransferase
MTKVYLAGPMRGILNYNEAGFKMAAEELRAAGFEVVSPWERDIEVGINMISATGEDVAPELIEQLVRWDVEQIFACDSIFMLVGWERSIGARAEHGLAVWLGREIQYE